MKDAQWQIRQKLGSPAVEAEVGPLAPLTGEFKTAVIINTCRKWFKNVQWLWWLRWGDPSSLGLGSVLVRCFRSWNGATQPFWEQLLSESIMNSQSVWTKMLIPEVRLFGCRRQMPGANRSVSKEIGASSGVRLQSLWGFELSLKWLHDSTISMEIVRKLWIHPGVKPPSCILLAKTLYQQIYRHWNRSCNQLWRELVVLSLFSHFGFLHPLEGWWSELLILSNSHWPQQKTAHLKTQLSRAASCLCLSQLFPNQGCNPTRSCKAGNESRVSSPAYYVLLPQTVGAKALLQQWSWVSSFTALKSFSPLPPPQLVMESYYCLIQLNPKAKFSALGTLLQREFCMNYKVRAYKYYINSLPTGCLHECLFILKWWYSKKSLKLLSFPDLMSQLQEQPKERTLGKA